MIHDHDTSVVQAVLGAALARGIVQTVGPDGTVVVADAPDKAVALRTLLQRMGCSAAFFAGDDANDEPVFEAAADDWVTVKVGAEGRTAAGFGLANPDAMLEVVDRLLEALR